jgi:hypothetical protein
LNPFPLHLLPNALGDYIAASATSLDCDPAYIAVPMMPTLATALQLAMHSAQARVDRAVGHLDGHGRLQRHGEDASLGAGDEASVESSTDAPQGA